MLGLFRSVGDRLRALFASDVALDFEAMFVRRQADRKADILRHAADLEQQGMKSVAAELREQAAAISIGRPLATILPATVELGGDVGAEPARISAADVDDAHEDRGEFVPAAVVTAKATKAAKKKAS